MKAFIYGFESWCKYWYYAWHRYSINVSWTLCDSRPFAQVYIHVAYAVIFLLLLDIFLRTGGQVFVPHNHSTLIHNHKQCHAKDAYNQARESIMSWCAASTTNASSKTRKTTIPSSSVVQPLPSTSSCQGWHGWEHSQVHCLLISVLLQREIRPDREDHYRTSERIKYWCSRLRR